VTTDQALALPGRTLNFKATAGSLPLLDAESGALQAEIAFVSYVVDGPARPVTFVFNGGPGAASAYLNIGALGPWRLPLDSIPPSVQPALVANAETWLDFTDLVFIDPAGTGYSRIAASGDQVKRHFWSIDGDADALAVFIRKWVEKNGRQRAAKFLVGESYGGFRGPKIARALAKDQGVAVRGMVLISPVLDFSSFGQRRHAPLTWVAHLPSMAATALVLKGAFSREALREAETYAAGDYLRDLMRGERDEAAVARISERVAALTGLDPALVKKLGGRVDTGTFQREIYRARGLVGSAYDPLITAYDPTPNAANSRFPDPMLDGTKAPLTTAMTDLYQRILNWRVEQPYRLLAGEVSSQWNWGRGRTGPEVVDDLRATLAADPLVRVMVAHGATDLVTPYFANQLILDQLPAFGSPDRVKFAVYGGGHMFYSQDASRAQLRDDAAALFRAAMQAEPARE
jgi:carboxypeptidase C (cathepsin A)